MKCAVCICDECTDYIIIDEEIDDRPNPPLIHFSVYTSVGTVKVDKLLQVLPHPCFNI